MKMCTKRIEANCNSQRFSCNENSQIKGNQAFQKVHSIDMEEKVKVKIRQKIKMGKTINKTRAELHSMTNEVARTSNQTLSAVYYTVTVTFSNLISFSKPIGIHFLEKLLNFLFLNHKVSRY